MNSSVDWVGLVVIVGVVAAVALGFRVASGGRMKPVLRRMFLVILVLVGAMLLWNASVAFL